MENKQTDFANQGDTISRHAAIDQLHQSYNLLDAERRLEDLPSAQPERLNDDDFETIRIHMNACKEELCNQQRWEEAAEYQRIIDRFMAFASAQSDIKQATKLLSDFIESCPGGNSYLITPDGEELITDWGYAVKGIQLIHDWAERKR